MRHFFSNPLELTPPTHHHKADAPPPVDEEASLGSKGSKKGKAAKGKDKKPAKGKGKEEPAAVAGVAGPGAWKEQEADPSGKTLPKVLLLPTEYPEVLEAAAKALAEAKKAAEEDEDAPPVEAPPPNTYGEVAPSKLYTPFQSAYTTKQLEEMAKASEKARELAEKEAAAAEKAAAEGGDAAAAAGLGESVSALSLGTVAQEEQKIPEGDEVDELMVAAFKAVDVFSSSLGAESPELWSSIYPQGAHPSSVRVRGTRASTTSRDHHASRHPPPTLPPTPFSHLSHPARAQPRLGGTSFVQPVGQVCGQALGGRRVARHHNRRPDARGRERLPGHRQLDNVARDLAVAAGQGSVQALLDELVRRDPSRPAARNHRRCNGR